ncbi:hypothetical protein AB833_08030 [Chromatiales bacterium (ex Bugula neritina AB1)]|nr:hypothetical protein AB833_08030 [Chromatiales bacterium (ex Bugula neritina AB1)]
MSKVGVLLLLITGQALTGHATAEHNRATAVPVEASVEARVVLTRVHDTQARHDENVLDRIVQPVTVMTRMQDGAFQTDHGSGILDGRRLITPISVLNRYQDYHARSLLIRGIPVTVEHIDPEYYLAIFNVPDEVCDEWCDVPLNWAGLDQIYPGQVVRWQSRSNRSFSATVTAITQTTSLKLPMARRCEGAVLIQTDRPFDPEDAGLPVVDHQTNTLLGIIQSSVEQDGSGGFVPMACVDI